MDKAGAIAAELTVELGGEGRTRPRGRVFLRASFLSLTAIVFALVLRPATAPAAEYAPSFPATLCSGTGGAAGECGELRGIGVDQSNGNIYAIDVGNRRIVQFAPDGTFARAFGVNVVASGQHDVGTGFEICEPENSTPTDICQVGANTGAGSIGAGHGVAVDSETHIVYVVTGAAKVAYYDGTTGALLGEVTGTVGSSPAAPSTFASLTGIAVDSSSAQHYLYVPTGTGTAAAIDKFTVPVVAGGVVTSLPGYQCQITGRETASVTECNGTPSKNGAFDGLSFLSGSNLLGGNLAVDSSGDLFLAEAEGGSPPVPRNVVSQFDSGGAFVRQIPVTAVTAAAAVASGASNRIFVVDGGSSVGGTKVQEIEVATGTVLSEFPTEGLSVGVAAYKGGTGLKGRLYVSDKEHKKIWVYQEVIEVAPEAEIKPATNVMADSAQLNGVVTVPSVEGEALTTTYHFEYSADDGLTWSNLPVPDASAGSVPGPVPVSQVVTGLEPNKTYRFRLLATTGVDDTSGTEQFKTLGAAPRVRYALGADELTDVVDPYGPVSAKVAGYVNPNNSTTHYRFEYGTTEAYGSVSPSELEPVLPAGGEDLVVKSLLTGLRPATTYHYRLVATNAAGTTKGPDRRFTTAESPQALNACGLPDGRCFELVSPPDKGPVGEAGQGIGLTPELLFQTTSNAERVAYGIGYALPTSTRGGEVSYTGERTPGGWQTAQLSPANSGQSVQAGSFNITSLVFWMSRNLDCGFVVSTLPLTADPEGQTAIETGGANLYRRNPSGGYTLISNRPPTNPAIAGEPPKEPQKVLYNMVGAAEDCSRVVFQSPYRYAGIDYSGGSAVGGLYEWADGTLSNAGEVPSPSGLQSAATTIAMPNETAAPRPWNQVSTDGAKVFFSAPSKQSGPEEGKRAIFMRKDGQTTVTVSQSQAATPNNGDSNFQTATPNGSKVFFTARYGLATNGSSAGPSSCSGVYKSGSDGAGCDLYVYDTLGGGLIDVSVDANPADSSGASVYQVLGASEDGSHVYYSARGQLVPGQGNTYAQNLAGSGAYNVYLARIAGSSVKTTFVATVSKASVTEENGDVFAGTSQVTPDGRHLIFQTASNVTGYESGGVREVYRFSADSEATVCVSCRRDGLASVGNAKTYPLGQASSNKASAAHRRLFISNDGSRIFFTKPDVLAPGAINGADNLYEWSNGQVYLLTTGVVGVQTIYRLEFLGASDDASSAFFRTRKSLVSQDFDERQDVYVARIDGGFAPPAAPPPPCNPLEEGRCGGGGTAGAAPGPAPASASPNGDGNVTPPKAKKQGKKKSGKHNKKKGKKQKQSGKRKQRRDANSKGRAGK